MALNSPYADAAEYTKRLGKEQSSDSASLLADLRAVSRWLERDLRRFFTKDTVAATRVYMTPRGRHAPRYGWAESENPWRDAGHSRELSIDDLVSVTSIAYDSANDGTYRTTLAANDYELLPRNAALGPEPEPYRQIALTSWGSVVMWPAGVRVRVIGIFGWPAVPEAIKRATIDLTGILRLETPRATRQVTDLGQVFGTTKAASDIVERLRKDYRAARSYV